MSDKSLTLDAAAEIDRYTKQSIAKINEVRSKNSGELVGFELVAHHGGQKLLVFADQLGMPGFRIGDAFVPGYGDTLVIGESTVFPTAPAEFSCVHHASNEIDSHLAKARAIADDMRKKIADKVEQLRHE